jgi:hypothetical protein
MNPAIEIHITPAATRHLPAASMSDVLLEQLQYLIDHTEQGLVCSCPDCRRYQRVRSILLEIFDATLHPQCTHDSRHTALWQDAALDLKVIPGYW